MFRLALDETYQLLRASRGAAISDVRLIAALNRSVTVVTCSHVEGYLEGIFLEAWDFLDQSKVSVDKVSDELRSRALVRKARWVVEPTKSSKIVKRARELFGDLGHLWDSTATFSAQKANVEAFTEEFQNPKPKDVRRLFRLFGIDNIFLAIQKASETELRGDTLENGLQELVDQRNQIAHGNPNTTPTALDTKRYVENARTLCRQVDVVVGQRLEEISGTFPWTGEPLPSAIKRVFEPPPWFMTTGT